MSVTETARPANDSPTPTVTAPAGHTDTLNGQFLHDAHSVLAVEGQASPQAIALPNTKEAAPAGSTCGRDQSATGTHTGRVPTPSVPGTHHICGTHHAGGTGDQPSPAATPPTTPIPTSPLADPLLALAADVLGDLEKVRIANENRLRQLTRGEEDSDGETRGFGLDESHPDVARLAALVGMLGDAEHKATLNLGRLMRKHALGPWLAAQKGIGEKQGARLLAAIGDPYIRPEIVREDGTVEPSRPRLVSELWAFCGYHVIKTPVGGQSLCGIQEVSAAGGSSIPTDQEAGSIAQRGRVGGEQNGHPGLSKAVAHEGRAGVAPKRARGAKANWSSAAKMRAFLVAESCIKQSGTPYRKVYDATREKYAEAVHAVECIRCGPKGKPAQPGSPLSAGHQHARALRAVAKEVLRDLWREAKRLHEEAAQGG